MACVSDQARKQTGLDNDLGLLGLADVLTRETLESTRWAFIHQEVKIVILLNSF